jgi:enamine deaminase RidA (YjgF/YER057c/UK114 family)
VASLDAIFCLREVAYRTATALSTLSEAAVNESEKTRSGAPDALRPLARQTFADGGNFEQAASYSRAVRAGSHIAVSGTAALDADGPLHPGDAYLQTLAAFEKALSAAEALGARRADVIRTRILLAPEAAWEDAVRAHKELFDGIAPANTTYFVGGFIPNVLVEVELDAVVEPS